MIVKNGKLNSIAGKLNSLRGIDLAGDINLAIIDLKVDLSKKIKDLNIITNAAIDSLCVLDENNKPVTETEEVEGGLTYFKYKFPDIETENKCKELINQIDNRDVEIIIPASTITREMISGIKCKTEQTEALLLMIQ